MPHAIRIHATGGPEVMPGRKSTVGDPGPGEARVRHTAIGVNFIDTYHRTGLYQLPLPTGIGTEAAGVVEAVGPGVDGSQAGDRVAYGGGPLGRLRRGAPDAGRPAGEDPRRRHRPQPRRR